jgi:hypothetical protein
MPSKLRLLLIVSALLALLALLAWLLVFAPPARDANTYTARVLIAGALVALLALAFDRAKR